MWRGLSVSLRDVLTCVLFAFLLAALAASPTRPKADAGQPQQGEVTVELFWDQGVDADVDLWVQAPGDVPVGYSNKGGVVFNLLRDDLGKTGDPLSRNMEIAVGRGFWPEGEYVVNAHLYRATDGRTPIKVHATVTTRKDGALLSRVDRDDLLDAQDQELTLLRLRLSKDGRVVPGSVDHVQTDIRSALGKARR